MPRHIIASAGEWPSATAQQRRHTRTGYTYLPTNVRRARLWWLAWAGRYAPPTPFRAAVTLELYLFRDCDCEPHLTDVPPDRDNLLKLATDCMTERDWWADDRLVHPTCWIVDCRADGIMARVETDTYCVRARKARNDFAELILNSHSCESVSQDCENPVSPFENRPL